MLILISLLSLLMAKPLCKKIDETISDDGIHKINDDDDDDDCDVRLLLMGLVHDELLSIAIRLALTIASFTVVEATAFTTTALPILPNVSLL